MFFASQWLRWFFKLRVLPACFAPNPWSLKGYEKYIAGLSTYRTEWIRTSNLKRVSTHPEDWRKLGQNVGRVCWERDKITIICSRRPTNLPCSQEHATVQQHLLYLNLNKLGAVCSDTMGRSARCNSAGSKLKCLVNTRAAPSESTLGLYGSFKGTMLATATFKDGLTMSAFLDHGYFEMIFRTRCKL